MTAQYRRKPTLVAVVHWTGENAVEIAEIAAEAGLVVWGHFSKTDPDRPHGVFNSDADRFEPFGFGDWIVREENGSLSAVTNVVFTEQYEQVPS